MGLVAVVMPKVRSSSTVFTRIIEERHGKAGIEQRIGDPAPADQGIPRQERRPAQAAAAEHRLNDIAKTGNAEPDEGPEIGEQPPVLGEAEGQKGRDKAEQHLQGVLEVGIQIGPWVFNLFLGLGPATTASRCRRFG